MYVKCIVDRYSDGRLVDGNKYKVLNYDSGSFYIKDELGSEDWWIKERFVKADSNDRGRIHYLYNGVMDGVSEDIKNLPYNLNSYEFDGTLVVYKHKKGTTMIKAEKVIHNKPATIVFWNDNTKTVVKCTDSDKYDSEKGFLMAYFQKTSGLSKSQSAKEPSKLCTVEDRQCDDVKQNIKHDSTPRVGDLIQIINGTEYYDIGWNGTVLRVDLDDKDCSVKFPCDGGETYYVEFEDLEVIKRK